MDKREAILVSTRIWSWLADNPEPHKSDWPGWKHNGGDVVECINLCPLCQYVCDKYETDLEYAMACVFHCPVKWIEFTDHTDPHEFVESCENKAVLPCEYYGSPYERWIGARWTKNYNLAGACAGEVRDALVKALDKVGA